MGLNGLTKVGFTPWAPDFIHPVQDQRPAPLVGLHLSVGLRSDESQKHEIIQ